MRDKASVIEYENGIALVMPLLSDTCINCNSPTCAKKGTPFPASNPQNLPLKRGDVVKIEAPASTQIVQGLFSLILPIASAIAGYFLAAPVARLFGIQVTEAMRAGGVLLMLVLTTGNVFLLSRSKLRLSKPQVSAIIYEAGSLTPKASGSDECLL